MFRYFIVLCLCISMSSCLTISKIDIELMRPGKVILPASVQSVAVVSLAPYSSRMYALNSNKKIETVALDPGKITALELVKQFQSQTQNRIDVLNGDTLDLANKLMPYKDSIPAKIISEASSTLNVDALLVIEKLKYRDTTVASTDSEDLYEYRKRMVTRYWIDLKWKLYAKDGSILDINYASDADQFDGVLSNTQYGSENLVSKKEMIEQAAGQLANQYVSRLLPFWESKERMLYSGTLDFSKAEQYMKTSQVDKAANIYRNYIKSGEYSLKVAALHNMAVAAEMKGSMEAALDWAKEANKAYKTEYETKYIEELEERLKEEHLIKKQLLMK